MPEDNCPVPLAVFQGLPCQAAQEAIRDNVPGCQTRPVTAGPCGSASEA